MKIQKILFLTIILISSYQLIAQTSQELEYTFQDRNNFRCKSILYIVNKESIFRIFDDRENGVDEKLTTDSNIVFVNNDDMSTIFYTNEQIEITRIPLYKSELIYDIKNTNLNINFTENKKKIDKYNCQEVKAELNGRKYSIWFTPDVELNIGPFRINWIPGLIVEIYEETNKIKLSLNSIKKSENTTDFNKYKDYILSKKALSYKEYENKVVDIMTAKKINSLAKVKEMGGILEYTEDQSAFTQFLIDIPTNLISELKKIN